MITINSKNLDDFKISKVIKFHTNTSSYNNIGSYWNTGSLKAIKGIKTETYRPLIVKVLFKGSSRVEILKNISKFVEESKECIFYRDNLYYEVEIADSTEPEILNPNTYIIEFSYSVLDVYEAERSITTNTSKSINISSPKPCYANLEISANTNVISAVISINDIDITVKNIKGNETVYIGSGKVTAGGKPKIEDVDIWEFPILNPGSNTIKVNRSDVSVTVKYNERW